MFHRRPAWAHVALIILVVIIGLSLSSPLAAQEEAGVARVRIGYFAFDPREYDTFIDGELASFNDGWNYVPWSFPMPSKEFVCCSTTPFMDIPAGVHEFAFAAAGEGMAAASAEPQEITLVPGHVHTLAVTGKLEDDSLVILNIDETEYAADTDLSESFFEIQVNDLAGTPATVLNDGAGSLIPYGQFVTIAYPPTPVGIRLHMEVEGDPPTVIVDTWSSGLPPGVTDLSVISGTFPGTLGQEFAWYWNWGYSGAIDTVEAGSIALGETIDGVITAIGQRARYSLNLDADTTLSIYARTGRASASRPWLAVESRFDPALYMYDAQGRLRYWNDELDVLDDSRSYDAGFDAGIEGLRLAAGSYLLEVAARLDAQAGTYTLEVATAE